MCTPRRTVRAGRAVLVGAVGLLCTGLLTGCGAAAEDPVPSASSTSIQPSLEPTAEPSTPAPVTIPGDGRTLASLGFTFGPVQEFSLPISALITARVDQPNNVAAVLSAPSAPEVAAYLRRALPLAGFVITEDNSTTASGSGLAMTFAGHGWSGRFTGDDRAAAVLLRPG